MGQNEDEKGARDGASVDTTCLACGRRYAIRPWPEQEAREGNGLVANETVAIYIAILMD